MTYHTDQRSCNSPADFPPETRIKSQHVLQRVVVIVNTCQRNIVPSVETVFIARRYASAVYAVVVCLSVRSTHAGIVSK